MDAKIPVDDDGGDFLVPKRSAVNENEEDISLFPSIKTSNKKQSYWNKQIRFLQEKERNKAKAEAPVQVKINPYEFFVT